MKKKTVNRYVYLTVKTPYLFLALILLSILALLYITLSTKVDVVQTYDAKIEDDKIIICEVGEYCPQKIYIYENRDRAIYHLEVQPGTVEYVDENMIIPMGELQFERETNFVKVDIPIKEITLFRRVFLQGGRNE